MIIRMKMKKMTQVVAVAVALVGLVAVAEAVFNAVNPNVFDPGSTSQVASEWVTGLGCPDCPTGNPPGYDPKIRGLLLAKSGVTIALNAAAQAKLGGISNVFLTATNSLGWDVRAGGNCGAGAPRFNVTTTDGNLYFIGCNSPPPSDSDPDISPSLPSGAWTRLRYDASDAFNASNGFAQDGTLPTKPVKSMEIVFDEGQDTGPTLSGMIVLDNIFIATTATPGGTIIGK